MIEQRGRGAWPRDGEGGTITRSKGKTVPGPYYGLHDDALQQIGLRTWCKREMGEPVQLSYNATFHAVVGIQMLCNGYMGRPQLSGDGIFGPATDIAVRQVQRDAGLVEDGLVGRSTMKALLMPVIKSTAARYNEPWRPIYGILDSEGGWDPGAVGYIDAADWGLAQINTVAHPHVSFAQAFCPSFAVRFIAGYLRGMLDALDGNLEDAVAAYNLGLGGARQWIRDGRPDVWTVPWSTQYKDRNVRGYIDRILNAAS